MKWRVVMEVTRADGAVRVHEIGGRAAVEEYLPRTVGPTLADGKLVLAGLQHHLVQAQTEDHCCRRRRCRRCGAPRPIKDKRSRRLLSSLGTVDLIRVRTKEGLTSYYDRVGGVIATVVVRPGPDALSVRPTQWVSIWVHVANCGEEAQDPLPLRL